MQHRHSLPFRNSADGGKMDLAKIKAGLENGRYRSASECIDDFKRVLSDCSLHNPPDDTIAEKAHSLEKFLDAKLALMPKEVQEVDAVKVKKSAKEISGLQDYMSSYFTPDQGKRSRRRTQHFEVDPLGKAVQQNKRKGGESSSEKRPKKKVFVQSSISKTNVRLLQKTEERGELVEKAHKNVEVVELDEEVEELDVYIAEEAKTKHKVRERDVEEVIQVHSTNSESGVESDESGESESVEDWATQFSNSIRRFCIEKQKLCIPNSPTP